MPGALSLSGRIEQSFLRRLEALPEDTRGLLLVAAAEPTGDPALLWRATQRLAIDAPALEPAESAGLIDIDGRVRTVDFVFESHRNRFLKLNTAQFKLERKAPKSKHKFKGL